MVFAAAGWLLWLTQGIKAQEQRNVLIQAQIERYDEDIKEIEDIYVRREQYLARARAIEELSAKIEPQPVEVLALVAELMSDGVSLVELELHDDHVTLAATASSVQDIERLALRLDADARVDDFHITVPGLGGKNLNSFSARFSLGETAGPAR